MMVSGCAMPTGMMLVARYCPSTLTWWLAHSMSGGLTGPPVRSCQGAQFQAVPLLQPASSAIIVSSCMMCQNMGGELQCLETKNAEMGTGAEAEE